MKSTYALLMVVISFYGCIAQESTVKSTNIIQRYYENFMDDVRIIRKCYLQKKSTCDQKELSRAHEALKWMGIRAGALILLIKGLSVGYKKLSRAQPKYKEELRKITADESALLVRLQRLDIKLHALVSENERFSKDCEDYQKKGKLDDLAIQSLISATFNRRKERKDILKSTLAKIKQEFGSLPLKSPEIEQYIRELGDMVAKIETQLQQLNDKYVK